MAYITRTVLKQILEDSSCVNDGPVVCEPMAKTVLSTVSEHVEGNTEGRFSSVNCILTNKLVLEPEQCQTTMYHRDTPVSQNSVKKTCSIVRWNLHCS